MKLQIKNMLLYIACLFVLMVLSVLIVTWLNASYLLISGYKVLSFLIFPSALVFKITFDSFSNISISGRVFIGAIIGLIWIMVAGIFTYYVLLNNYGA